MTCGAAAGVLAVVAGSALWQAFGRRTTPSVEISHGASESLDLFRLPSGAAREMFLVPAGPDGIGEPALAGALFPGENPPRELAELYVANVSTDETWRLDLAGESIRCRSAAGADWRSLEALRPETALDGAQTLRLRSLGGGESDVSVQPKSMRHVLLALPRGMRFSSISDVQWGTTPLLRDRLDVERIRRFREDPAATTTGR
jgi:hypothetical protein